MGGLAVLRTWARQIKQHTLTLWFVSRHPQTPLLAKLMCGVAVAYALSPIDLIPDFIPVLGWLDDVVLLPAMLWCAMRLTPDEVLATCQAQASEWLNQHHPVPQNRWGLWLVLAVWIGLLFFFLYWLFT